MLFEYEDIKVYLNADKRMVKENHLCLNDCYKVSASDYIKMLSIFKD